MDSTSSLGTRLLRTLIVASIAQSIGGSSFVANADTEAKGPLSAEMSRKLTAVCDLVPGLWSSVVFERHARNSQEDTKLSAQEAKAYEQRISFYQSKVEACQEFAERPHSDWTEHTLDQFSVLLVMHDVLMGAPLRVPTPKVKVTTATSSAPYATPGTFSANTRPARHQEF